MAHDPSRWDPFRGIAPNHAATQDNHAATQDNHAATQDNHAATQDNAPSASATDARGVNPIDVPLVDVVDEITRATPPRPTDIGVEFDDGPVTLAGTISSWAKKIADEEAAYRACEMLDVANDGTFEAEESDGFVPDDEI